MSGNTSHIMQGGLYIDFVAREATLPCWHSALVAPVSLELPSQKTSKILWKDQNSNNVTPPVPMLFPGHWLRFKWLQKEPCYHLLCENQGCVSRSSWVSAGQVLLCVTACTIATAGSQHLQNQCSLPAFVLLSGLVCFYRGGCWHWGGEWQAQRGIGVFLPQSQVRDLGCSCSLPAFAHSVVPGYWGGSYSPTFAWHSSQNCRRD